MGPVARDPAGWAVGDGDALVGDGIAGTGVADMAGVADPTGVASPVAVDEVGAGFAPPHAARAITAAIATTDRRR
jgi:hypothetical protein